MTISIASERIMLETSRTPAARSLHLKTHSTTVVVGDELAAQERVPLPTDSTMAPKVSGLDDVQNYSFIPKPIHSEGGVSTSPFLLPNLIALSRLSSGDEQVIIPQDEVPADEQGDNDGTLAAMLFAILGVLQEFYRIIAENSSICGLASAANFESSGRYQQAQLYAAEAVKVKRIDAANTYLTSMITSSITATFALAHFISSFRQIDLHIADRIDTFGDRGLHNQVMKLNPSDLNTIAKTAGVPASLPESENDSLIVKQQLAEIDEIEARALSSSRAFHDIRTFESKHVLPTLKGALTEKIQPKLPGLKAPGIAIAAGGGGYPARSLKEIIIEDLKTVSSYDRSAPPTPQVRDAAQRLSDVQNAFQRADSAGNLTQHGRVVNRAQTNSKHRSDRFNANQSLLQGVTGLMQMAEGIQQRSNATAQANASYGDAVVSVVGSKAQLSKEQNEALTSAYIKASDNLLAAVGEAIRTLLQALESAARASQH